MMMATYIAMLHGHEDETYMLDAAHRCQQDLNARITKFSTVIIMIMIVI